MLRNGRKRILNSTMEMLPVLFVLLLARIQGRPLDEKPVTELLQTTTTTSPPSATESPGCNYDGNWYPPGSEISQGSDGYSCYGIFCDASGQLVAWDNFNCGTTAQPSTTTHPTPTSIPPQATRPGCFISGKWYPPESDITRKSDGNGWCYGTYCGADGQIVAWDDWNCGITVQRRAPTTTPTPTTAPPQFASTVPIPLGCFQNGAWYEPGSEISRESDGKGWCHGISCDSSGRIVAWDDSNCETTENSTPENSQLQQEGCYYEDQWHPYGSIFEGSDGKGCKYGAICEMDGKVTRWDEIDCQATD